MQRNVVAAISDRERHKVGSSGEVIGHSKFIYCILAVALLAKLLLLFFVMPHLSNRLAGSYGQSKYADAYDRLAMNLADGNGYRFFSDTALTVMREPGYPLFLAGIFKLFGKSLAATQAANLILSLGAVFLVRRILVEFWPEETPLWASFVFFFHPGILIAESRGGYEILFMLLLCGFALLLLRAARTERAFDYIKAGLALGLCVIVKSTLILFPFFYVAYQILFKGKNGYNTVKPIRNFVLVSISLFIMLSPWILRNYWLTEKFIPTASVFGVSAHAGQYISENIGLRNRLMDIDLAAAKQRSVYAKELGLLFRDGYYQYFFETNDEIRFNSFLIKQVLDKYKQKPSLFIKTCMYNAVNFWFAGKSWSVTLINLFIQLPMIIMAIYAIKHGVANKNKLIHVIVLIIVCYYFAYIPILGQARYSVPLLPLLWVLACTVIWRGPSGHPMNNAKMLCAGGTV